VAPARAADLWLIGGVPVVNQAAQWQGIRADAADMWTPDAPWKGVAGHTRVILFSPGILLRAKDDDLLKQAFSDMKRRNIDFAVELGLLTRTDKCQAKFEGYLDDIEAVRRIVDRISRTGGDLRYIAMDEPFYYGHQYSGPGACHESAAELARRIAGSIAVVRKVFPNVQIGDEEVVDSSRAATDELAGWADVFKEATGEPLAFLHTDVSWSQAAMRNLVPLSAALKTRHVPLGVMYNAEGDATTSDEVWTQNAKEHFAEINGVLGVHPDHAVFQSWVTRPSRMMPEDQPGTLTNLALAYLHPVAEPRRLAPGKLPGRSPDRRSWAADCGHRADLRRGRRRRSHGANGEADHRHRSQGRRLGDDRHPVQYRGELRLPRRCHGQGRRHQVP
jgi:hypothetical protein